MCTLSRSPRRSAVALALVATALLPASPAWAGGFLVYDQSGEAVAKGSAVVASTREPAAVWYNPAALPQVPGYALSLGGALVTATCDFTPTDGGAGASTEPGLYVLPHVFATGPLTPWLSAGLGVYSVFGLGIAWPDDWQGRESTIEANLTTLQLNPTLAVRLNPRLSLGAGFDVVRATIDQTNGLPAPVEGTVRFGAGAWGYGANLGLLWQILPDTLHVGATWRSRIRLDFPGRVDFRARPEFLRDLRDQRADSGVTLPDVFALGLAYRPTATIELGLDGNLVLWNLYDRTVLTLADGSQVTVTHDYRPSFVVRAGLDWTTPVTGLALRAGVLYDQTPAPAEHLDPSTPDADQVDLTAGVGYSWRFLTTDLGYQLLLYLPAEATTGREGPEGTYRTLAHLLALTVTVRYLP